MIEEQERERQRQELEAVWPLGWVVSDKWDGEWSAKHCGVTVTSWPQHDGAYEVSVEAHADVPDGLEVLDGVSASGDSRADAVRALRAEVEDVIVDYRAWADALTAWLGDDCTGDGGPSDDCDGGVA